MVQVLAVVVCIGSLITLQRCDKYCRCRIKGSQSETEILLPTNESKRRDIDRFVCAFVEVKLDAHLYREIQIGNGTWQR